MNISPVVALCFLLASGLAVAADPVPEHATSAVQMTQAARAFIDTLDDGELELTVLPLRGDERTTWSNLPIIMVEPKGILIADMNDEQRSAVHALLRASLSSQGYAKINGVMRLDDILYDMGVEELRREPERRDDPVSMAFLETRSSGNYAIAIYGEPGEGDWGWKLAGHHGAMNFTVADGRVGFTPTFLGSNPMAVENGPYAGWMALPHEGSRGIDLMKSLTAQQAKAARIHDEVANDVFEGPGRRASLSKYEGLKADELSGRQMHLLRALVAEYVQNMDFDAAAAQLEIIDNAGWGNLWFSWRGPVDHSGEFYYRVHGPRLLIEYNRQDANHDHMIIRDPQNDYGEDWLEHHYEEHHPTMQEAMETARRRAMPGD